MNDICETIGHSEIQHGAHSNRIYLMKLDRRDLPEIVGRLDELAGCRGYTKLFAKVPVDAEPEFISGGYRREALIPGFYQGKDDAVFLGKYPDPARAEPDNRDEIATVLELAKAKFQEFPEALKLPEGCALVPCRPEHVEAMSRIYRVVFPSYPFPIHDPDYLRETMESHIDYFGMFKGEELIALSSAEMDLSGSNVEMTDFATLPGERGRGLARFLLQEMERAMRKRKMRTAYTIARAVSPGMNITFSRMGYRYSGTLVNNTHISGSIESMNIWYKSLSA